MLNFDFYSPTYFVFGKDRENEAGKLVRRFGGSRVLIVYGGGSVKRSGLLDRVRASLEAENLHYAELGGICPNPRSGSVYEGIRICKEEKLDFVLSVGGGSCIDAAKAIAMGTLYEGDFWDFYMGKAEPQRALPVGTVLTLSATGSEGSMGSVITHEDGMRKRAVNNDVIRPAFSVLNPALTETLPPYQTACGIVDIMAHIQERYFTNTPAVATTDRLCEALLVTVIEAGRRAMACPEDYDARAELMWSGMLAHNNVVGVGREQDWSSHEIEHELSALYDCAHGAGLAVIFPAWMEYVLHTNVARFAQFAERVWGVEPDPADPEKTAREGMRRYRAFLREIGMPITFAEIGAKAEDIDLLTERLFYNHPGCVGAFRPLQPEDCRKIYEIAARGYDD
ncbi:MAG: iron-containing alcohol dehydrogenase [Oscillospiraceae bacterium]|nr:iron-containing alcohol dehydrogenase [Oscillospiraceae bacterium]